MATTTPDPWTATYPPALLELIEQVGPDLEGVAVYGYRNGRSDLTRAAGTISDGALAAYEAGFAIGEANPVDPSA